MLNVSNWSDRQLDELQDLLRTADSSIAAVFIAMNYLASGSRIITDADHTTLRVTVGSNPKTVSLSPGVFQHGGYVSQVDSAQTVNILDTAVGQWGTGLAANPTNPRWSIICVKWNQKSHTPAQRWFVNDTVVPNTYYQQNTNTLINKAYYDITVVHGTPSAVPVVPNAPSGYWTICEIKVPAGATSISQSDIYDTTLTSSKSPPNWLPTTRVLRMEFQSSMFYVDHDPNTGYHRLDNWHIGATKILVSGTELNQALDGIGGTVVASNLNKLTNGSLLASGELHTHGGGVNWSNHGTTDWTLTNAYTDPPDNTLSVSFTTIGITNIRTDWSFAFIYHYSTSLRVRLLVDLTPIIDMDVWSNSPDTIGWFPNSHSFQWVYTGLPAGVHTIKVQALSSVSGWVIVRTRQITLGLV